MKNFKNILWGLFDIFSLVVGTILFVINILKCCDEELAGFGAGLVVFGLLVKSWRSKNNSTVKDKNGLNVGFVIIFLFTMWAKNYNEINSNSSDIQSVERGLSDKLEESTFYFELDKLKSNSHQHSW